CLQLMSDGVDEGIVLLIPPDFPNEKRSVDHHTADDYGKKDDTQKQQNSGAPVEQYPTDIEEDADGNQSGAENDKEHDRGASSGEDHTYSVQRSAVPKRGSCKSTAS